MTGNPLGVGVFPAALPPQESVPKPPRAGVSNCHSSQSMILSTITIPLRDNPHDDMSSIEKEDNDTWSKKDGSDYSGRGSGEDGKKGNVGVIWDDDKINRVSIIRSTENGDIQIHSDDLLYLMKFTDNTLNKFCKCVWCTMTFQQ